MAAFDDVLLHKFELGVIFVDVILFDAIGQSADNEEVAIANADAASAVKDFLNLMAADFLERGGIVDVHP